MSKRSKEIFKGNERSFYDYFGKDGINNKNFPQEFMMILGLFVEDSNCNITKCYIHLNRLFIEGRNYNNTKSCELMLRFGNGQLVVARIEFIHQRKGYMTRLYEILKIIQKKYKLNKIVIEQCITEGSENWAKKNGFINYKVQSYIEP